MTRRTEGGTRRELSRRDFIATTAVTAATLAIAPLARAAERANRAGRRAKRQAGSLSASDLPAGSAPPPILLPHFPSRLHAFVWRNWPLVPVERMAKVVGARPAEILRVGRAMGLAKPPRITPDQQRRSALTVIRRNWHLLPYEQLLDLLGWTAEQMAFTLREDDFLFVKLGNLKPKCEPLRCSPPEEQTLAREREIAGIVREEFPEGVGVTKEPLFAFVSHLASKPAQSGSADHATRNTPHAARLSPRYCYSYFALYGDPLLEPETDPYPDGFLARLAASGVDGVWLQAVLYKLAPFPWQPGLSARYQERLANLRKLVARARKHGIGVWLYLNEPRAMPLAFFHDCPQMKGVVEGDHATLCTSDADVRRYLVESVASICRAVPDLAGFFTISGSENLTNCWSHGGGASCPRCGKRGAAEVIAEVNGLFWEGIRKGGAPRKNASPDGSQAVPSATTLIVWDWGWHDAWVEGIVERLPQGVALMSVSEWSIPIRRGGVETTVGEYSISTVGPGPRAKRHWDLARKRGLKTMAKIQAGNTWELSAVPYIPAVANVAQHAANLRAAGVQGLMLGWTLGGYPSPNLEVVAEMAGGAESLNRGTVESLNREAPSPEEAMSRVARRRFGNALAPAVVQAWKDFSAAFSEFPFHGGLVYNAPMQYGPSNLLCAEPTGYRATMIGFPYDDLDGWRQVYPAEVFIGQFDKVADGFERALANLKRADESGQTSRTREQRRTSRAELNVAEAAAIHFRTTANQARFVHARRALAAAQSAEEARPLFATLEKTLRDEIALARRLHALQTRDSRLGFEASNQYYYVPVDLAEKVLNCRDLLDRWLPAQRARWRR
ncbi:MAG: twin-arginine translocation signal domain-containing protein [Verrucomicrobia bacterium]|nr:twin-arginine translocation signal domain-containing protein [Verrucomicrobiota bacterium]